MSEEHQQQDQPTNLPAIASGSQSMSTMRAGGKPSAIIAHSMEDAWRLAKAVCLAGLAPSGMESPEACMVAIMMGAEVGLTPMTSIQRIAVINKRPSIWGDAALGLVRASGLLMEIVEGFIGEGDQLTAVCRVHRKHEKPVERDFSVSDAKRAGLWNKKGPWQDYPKRMLQMRARAFALRDVFPDVLGGMYIAEELQGGGDRDRVEEEKIIPPNPMEAANGPAADARTVEAGSEVAGARSEPASGSDPERVRLEQGSEQSERDVPVGESATGAAGADDDTALPNFTDPDLAVKGWIAQLDTMNVEEEIKNYMTDERIWEHLEAGDQISRRAAAQIEQAYGDAMARAGETKAVVPPNPMAAG